MLPSGDCIFCDDIRFEQQNKFSLIGCYGADLIVSATPPFAIPKLGVLVKATLPLGAVSSFSILFYNPEEDTPFYSREEKGDTEDYDQEKEIEKIRAAQKASKDVDIRRGYILPMLFSPFQVNKLGFIRVRMKYKDELIKIGALYVRQPHEGEPIS